MKRTITILLCLLAVLTACEREIPYKGEYQDPKLVIQSQMAANDSVLYCTVSRSAFFLETGKKAYELTEGVTLTVTRENGETISVPDTSIIDPAVRYYRIPLATPLQVGEVVRLQASHPSYPTAFGQDSIVPMPDYTITSCVWDSTEATCRVKIQMGDNADIHGVMAVRGALTYSWNVDHYLTDETYVYSSTSKNIRSKDNIFASLGNAFSSEYGYNAKEEMYIKADEARNREISLEFPLYSNYYTPVSMEIQLIALSEDAYLYRRALYNYFGAYGTTDMDLGSELSSMFGIEEPVQLYTNIENGYGIVAGRSPNIQTYYFLK